MRPRGADELGRSLGERGFTPEAVHDALERLARAGLLDDLAAARSAVRLRGARYGRARVERELKARGLAKETIAAAFQAEGGAEREGEALRHAFERLWKAKANLEPSLRRRRVFDALTRRGFPAAAISEIIRGWYEID
ncbi:MAG TPA: regulatory protein RecX [Thermoanaerobaculia bacterium]